jgi:hypothetical protein
VKEELHNVLYQRKIDTRTCKKIDTRTCKKIDTKITINSIPELVKIGTRICKKIDTRTFKF